MKGQFLLGVDLGTSSVKVLLLSTGEDGRVGGDCTVSYPLSTPRPGWSEQEPSDWWRGVSQAIRLLLEQTGVRAGQITGVALSGQMHGATLLDAAGEVLRPCILWNDQRSGAQCEALTKRLGLATLLKWVANPALAGFTAPKLIWVRENEPDVFAAIATVLLPKDYINFRLTGELATEPSDASGTLLFDVVWRRWSEEMIRALDVPLSWLPPVHPSTGVIGKVSAAAASSTGLQPGTPVVAGGADNACAAVGMGVIAAGQVLTSLGTSGTVVAPSSEARLDPDGRLHLFCHAAPDTWYLMGVVLSAGGSLRWFRDTLADIERGHAQVEGRDVYDVIGDAASRVPAGSEGLVFLPYLTGERTPHGDPYARGAFFGLSLRHTRSHMARSVFEGITFALADSANLMRDLGIRVDAVRITGGGARSRFWRQMQADIVRARVVTTQIDAGPAFGAAMLAGVGTGVFPSLAVATNRLVHTADELAPDPATADLYARYLALYDSLYPALADRFAALGDLTGAL